MTILKGTVMTKSLPELLADRSEQFWFSVEELAGIFAISRKIVEKHIKDLFAEGERNEETDVKVLPEIDDDGKLIHVARYSLDTLISIGLRIGGEKGKRFRKWAFQNLSEYVVKGFILDDERLKNPDGGDDYFDELQGATEE